MNKLFLTILLGAIIVLTGMFAFSSVEPVTSTHDNVVDKIGDLVCTDIGDGVDTFDAVNNDCSAD